MRTPPAAERSSTSKRGRASRDASSRLTDSSGGSSISITTRRRSRSRSHPAGKASRPRIHLADQGSCSTQQPFGSRRPPHIPGKDPARLLRNLPHLHGLPPEPAAQLVDQGLVVTALR